MKEKKLLIGIIVLIALASLSFSVEALPTFPHVNITFVSQTPDPVEPNSVAELRFRVRNIGTKVISDLVLELVPSYPFSPVDGGTKVIGTLPGRDNVKDSDLVVFKVKVDKDVIEGEHDIKVRYKLDNNWAETEAFKVRVRTYDVMLGVEDVVTEPSKVAPGKQFKLKIKLKNLVDSVMRNVKVTLSLLTVTTTTTGFSTLELPFTPIGSSNEKIVEVINPGKEAEVEFDLIVDGDAGSEIYKLPIYIAYSDDLGRNFTKANIVGLVVDEVPDLYAVVESSEVYMPGQTGEILVKFVNKGSSDVKFLNLVVKDTAGVKLLSPHEVYVGNIDSDDYESTDVKVYVTSDAKDNIKLPLVVGFRDENNNQHIKDFELVVPLYNKEEAIKFGMLQKSNKIGYVIFIVIIVVGIILYRRWRKKKLHKK